MYDGLKKYKKKTVGDGYHPQYNKNKKKIVYMDWAGSGRLYKPIEDKLVNEYGVLYGNTHSYGNYVSEFISHEYKNAKKIIKEHFGADENYSLIASGYGMTAAMNKFQNIISESFDDIRSNQAVVFILKYEHNSNYITWKKSGFECVVVDKYVNGQVDLDSFEKLVGRFKNKKLIIGSFTGCSNVTGIIIDLKPLCKIIKKNGGIVAVDYTTIAPYENINMKEFDIDALIFSSHKLLGGVGGPGILILKNDIYRCAEPTSVGGGVVKWINIGGEILYQDNIEDREEAGTQPLLQVIKCSLAIKLKEKMASSNNLRKKEIILKEKMLYGLKNMPSIVNYDLNISNRLPIFSFNFNDIMFEDAVTLLNERYGYQVRGGCCCASIYGHSILKINNNKSSEFLNQLKKNQSTNNVHGWVRISLSPINTEKEVDGVINSIHEIVEHGKR